MAPGVRPYRQALERPRPGAGPRPSLVAGAARLREVGSDGPPCPMLLVQTCALLTLRGSVVLTPRAVDENAELQRASWGRKWGESPGSEP